MSIADKLQTVAENQEKVFEAGKTKEWSDFWDVFQDNGKRTDYRYAFYQEGASAKANWGDLFYPKHNMKPYYAGYMFAYLSSAAGSKTIDLEARLNECGVTLDFSGCKYGKYCFAYSQAISVLPEIDLSYVTTAEGHKNFFYSSDIVTIRKLIPPKCAIDGYFFCYMSYLENIVIEGELYGDFRIDASYLTHESLMSFINALKDLSEDTSGKTYKITLGSRNIPTLTQSELDMITAKGWTYA